MPSHQFIGNPKRPRFKAVWLLPLLMFVGLAVLLGGRLGHDPSIVPLATNAKPLPVFTLTEFISKRAFANADLPKTPFILNIWGSWCPSCVEENPKLLQLAQEGVTLVGVNYKDEPENANRYLTQHGNPYAFILEDKDGRLGVDLGVTGAPESYIIDAHGIIHQHIVGVISDEVWQQKIKPCLAALNNPAKITSKTTATSEPVNGKTSCLAS